MNNDLKIAQEATLEDIYKIAQKAGIKEEALEPYGRDKAKIDLNQLNLENEKDGVSVYIPPVSNSVEKSASLLKQNLCEN